MVGSSTSASLSEHSQYPFSLALHTFNMAGPDYGALGATFKITRVLQAVSMIAVIGMTANFISEMVSANATPPKVLIGTLTVVSAALKMA